MRQFLLIVLTCLGILIGVELAARPIHQTIPTEESRLRAATLPADPVAAIGTVLPGGWSLESDQLSRQFPTYRPLGNGRALTFSAPIVSPTSTGPLTKTSGSSPRQITVWIMPPNYDDGGDPNTWKALPQGMVPRLFAITPGARIYISDYDSIGWIGAADNILRALFPEAN